MDPARSQFFADVYGDARIAASQTGVPISVILAQWADETGYGTSHAWTAGHNYAGVSPAGHPASYPDRAAGLAAYIKTLLNPRYTPVRTAGDPTAAAVALGESPWAGGHYASSGHGPGGDLLAIISTNDLTRYDEPATAPAASGGGGADAVLTGLSGGDPFGFRSFALKVIFTMAGVGLVVAGVYHSIPTSVRHAAGGAAKLAGEVAA